jgi:hypothetical protein
LNGVQVLQGTLSAISTVGNTKPVNIGRNGAPTSGGYFNGKLDDVRIWNVARTALQLGASYKVELTGAQAGLVGNWKFDEAAGAVAADSAGARKMLRCTVVTTGRMRSTRKPSAGTRNDCAAARAAPSPVFHRDPAVNTKSPPATAGGLFGMCGDQT